MQQDKAENSRSKKHGSRLQPPSLLCITGDWGTGPNKHQVTFAKVTLLAPNIISGTQIALLASNSNQYIYENRL